MTRRSVPVTAIPVTAIVLLGVVLLCAPAMGASNRDSTDPMPDLPEQVISQSPVVIANGSRENLNVSVVSWRDIPFQTVKRQQLDFSCGSAAVATLLSYIYEQPISEAEVFHAMFAAGDQDKIRHQGFSMLDIRSYLAQRGLNADGYRISLDDIERKQVPFLALIVNRGYNHFVVVKSIRRDSVLVGDPIRGNMVMRRGEFLGKWNGIALIVKNQARQARALFGDEREWRMARTLSYPSARTTTGIDSARADQSPWQIDRAGIDLFETTLSTIKQVQSSIPAANGGMP